MRVQYGITTEEFVIREVRINEVAGWGDSASQMMCFKVIMPLKLQSTMNPYCKMYCNVSAGNLLKRMLCLDKGEMAGLSLSLNLPCINSFLTVPEWKCYSYGSVWPMSKELYNLWPHKLAPVWWGSCDRAVYRIIPPWSRHLSSSFILPSYINQTMLSCYECTVTVPWYQFHFIYCQ